MQNTTQLPPDEERFWPKNQLVFTFHSPLDPAEGKQHIIDRLPLDELDQHLRVQHSVALQSFGPNDVPGRRGDIPQGRGAASSDLRDPHGKYLFPSPSGEGSLLIACFHIVPPGQEPVFEDDHIPDILNSFNAQRPPLEPVEGAQTTRSSMPNWYGACTGDVTHGCPVAPPIAVGEDGECPEHPGYWPITVSPLPGDLESVDGAGVTVLVLDTLPKVETIAAAVQNVPAGANRLLVDMAQGMVEMDSPFTPRPPATGRATPPAINIWYQHLPDDEDKPKDQPQTGKDIDGNLAGYPIADHGLFVAGIIRSVAPGADIVCVRILNDFGVDTTSALLQVLEGVAHHLREKKQENPDFQPRLIINLSLVTTPYDWELERFGLDGQLAPLLREGLQLVFQALGELGVVFVAAAGNDSDPRHQMQDMLDKMTGRGMAIQKSKRLDPRYPAALADSIAQVISVGAVDKNEQAARYSNYPGANGVATYGGSMPVRDKKKSTAGHAVAKSINDALRGVYTTQFYPTLSRKDQSVSQKAPAGLTYPTEDAPNHNAWAYWSGTSFSTPIITGLAARILQAEALASAALRQHVIALAGTQTVSWTGLNAAVSGPVIYAQQCTTTDLNSQDSSKS